MVARKVGAVFSGGCTNYVARAAGVRAIRDRAHVCGLAVLSGAARVRWACSKGLNFGRFPCFDNGFCLHLRITLLELAAAGPWPLCLR